ncbi:hypothetical protein LJB86_02760 [Deltaproteobacteria bacterium OttesenSCG-928-M10]|nr:hypothetical protein [Deltaproteobacteria bacterium OttesenSCG-928-M10]
MERSKSQLLGELSRLESANAELAAELAALGDRFDLLKKIEEKQYKLLECYWDELYGSPAPPEPGLGQALRPARRSRPAKDETEYDWQEYTEVSHAKH